MRTPLVLLALLFLLSAPADAQFFYGMTDRGRVVVNGSVLDQLPGKGGDNLEERWWDLVILGQDRYALRLDGLIFKNGVKFDTLPYDGPGFPTWLALHVEPDGGDGDPGAVTTYALRSDGAVAQNGVIIVDHPTEVTIDIPPGGPVTGDIFFLAMEEADGKIYSLRADGAVFESTEETEPVFDFDGGDNPVTGGIEGIEFHTQWGHLAHNAITGELFALRADGILFKGDLPDGDEAGTAVGSLPDIAVAGPNNSATLYNALGIQSDGDWVVLRGTGDVFTGGNGTATPIVDLPGDAFDELQDPEDGDASQLYLDLATRVPPGDGSPTDEVYALRFDGRLFETESAGEGPLVIFTKNRYRVLAISEVAPDLSNVKNSPPSAAVYKTLAIEGDPVVVPIHLTDPDLASDELVVTMVDEELLPEGMTWDAVEREVTWDAAAEKGSYKFVIEVDDGQLKKPKKFKYAIKVLPPDEDPEKNKKPQPIKVKKATALVGQVMEIRIGAVDKDGDELTVTPVLDKGVFVLPESDAAFDEETGLLTWTAQFEDIGKTFAQFEIADGSVNKQGKPIVKKFKLKIKVVNALIF